jgi:hypothetical protein
MKQRGFFDVERRLDAISANGDPLETIEKISCNGRTSALTSRR